MGKWIGVLVVLIAVGLGVGGWVWMRAKNNVIPGYEKVGVVTKNIAADLLVVPKADNVMPFYTKLDDKRLYDNEQYEIYEIKEKKGAIDHAVGYFWGWEKIEGSKDKVMKVRAGLLGNTYKFRVALEQSGEWEKNETSLTLVDRGGQKERKGYLYKLPENELDKWLNFGNKVVVYPGLYPNAGGYRENNNVIWISHIILGT